MIAAGPLIDLSIVIPAFWEAQKIAVDIRAAENYLRQCPVGADYGRPPRHRPSRSIVTHCRSAGHGAADDRRHSCRRGEAFHSGPGGAGSRVRDDRRIAPLVPWPTIRHSSGRLICRCISASLGAWRWTRDSSGCVWRHSSTTRCATPCFDLLRRQPVAECLRAARFVTSRRPLSRASKGDAAAVGLPVQLLVPV